MTAAFALEAAIVSWSRSRGVRLGAAYTQALCEEVGEPGKFGLADDPMRAKGGRSAESPAGSQQT